MVKKLLSRFLLTGALFLSGFSFTVNLKFGDQDVDVLHLQQELNADPATQVAPSGPGSQGEETDYFGPATLAAVIKFQDKYASEILSPAGLAQGNGFVGVLTRAKLASISAANNGDNTTSSVAISSHVTSSPALTQTSPQTEVSAPAPVIQQIIPDHGPYGTPITIIGDNFTGSNTIWTTYGIFSGVKSADGKTMQFVFTDPPLQQLQEVKTAAGAKLSDIEIPFYINVVNGNGSTTGSTMFTLQIQ